MPDYHEQKEKANTKYEVLSICNDIKWFTSYTPLEPAAKKHFVNRPSGTRQTVFGTGSVVLYSQIPLSEFDEVANGKGKRQNTELCLENVLFVPDAAYNLIHLSSPNPPAHKRPNNNDPYTYRLSPRIYFKVTKGEHVSWHNDWRYIEDQESKPCAAAFNYGVDFWVLSMREGEGAGGVVPPPLARTIFCTVAPPSSREQMRGFMVVWRRAWLSYEKSENDARRARYHRVGPHTHATAKEKIAEKF